MNNYEALYQLFNQVYWTAGDQAGRDLAVSQYKFLQHELEVLERMRWTNYDESMGGDD